MAGTSRANATSDWLLPPNLVFKTFEENLMKPPFYGGTPHIVPEKISESFVDQNGMRCYRVKWLDTWLTEQHMLAAFPHLITEYWINKPINENVDYQYNIIPNRVPTHLQIPATTSAVSVSVPQKVIPVPPSSRSHESLGETMQEMSEPATSIITNLFANVASKEVESARANEVAIQSNSLVPVNEGNVNVGKVEQSGDGGNGKDNTTEAAIKNIITEGRNTDFVSAALQLPEKVTACIEKQGERSKPGERMSLEHTSANITPIVNHVEIPKISDNSMILLFDKNGSYTVTERNKAIKEKPLVSKVIAPFNHQIKAHLNNFVVPNTAIRLPTVTLDQFNQQQQQHQQQQQQQQQQHSAQLQPSVQADFNNPEKKMAIKKSPTKQAKPTIPKERIPVVCDICGKTISSRKNLRVHKTVKHFKNGSFACDICGRKFALNRDLKRHMPLHTNERKYQCPHCGLQCKQPGHLTKHLRTHTEVMNWRCDCCFKNFKVQAELKAHCFTEHADIHKENLTCSVCKEKLKLPNSVYLHSLRHSGVREFQCEICKASFKLKQHMQVHMRTHTKPKEPTLITCPICQREFKFKHTYRKHFSKHLEKTKEEYDENTRIKQEEKRRKQEEKKHLDVKPKKTKTKGLVETIQTTSDGEDSKAQPKRKQRKPERVCYDKKLDKAKGSLEEEDIKNYKCTQCVLAFPTQALLRSHKKCHKSETTQLLSSQTQSNSNSFVDTDEEKAVISCNVSFSNDCAMLMLPTPVTDTLQPRPSSSGVDIACSQSSNETISSMSQQLSSAIALSALAGYQVKEGVTMQELGGNSIMNSRAGLCSEISDRKSLTDMNHRDKKGMSS